MNTQAVLTDSKKNNNSKMLGYIFYKLKDMRPKLILNIIFAVLSYPGMAVSLCILSYVEQNQGSFMSDGNRELFQIGVILAVLCIVSIGGISLLTYMNAVQNFEYYYKRTVVDMNYCLPLTRKERFWGDFIAGIAPILILYILSSLISVLILLIARPVEMTSNPEAWPMVFTFITIGFIFFLFLYSLVVFCTSLSGRVFETGVYPLVLSGLIPAVIALVFVMLFRHPFLMYEDALVDILTASSPMGFLIGSLGGMPSWFHYLSDDIFIAVRAEIIIPVIIIIAALILASAVFAQKRSTERVGMPFVFKSIYHIYLSAIMFVITALFIYINRAENNSEVLTPSIFFAMFITTALTFLIIEVITNRGFKKMHIAALRYAATIAGSLIITFGLHSFDSFGLYKYIPQTDEIESYQISGFYSYNTDVVYEIIELDNQENYGNRSTGYRYVPAKATFKKPENIELITSLHADAVVFKPDDRYGRPPSFKVNYKLKNGKEVRRNIYYSLTVSEQSYIDHYGNEVKYYNFETDERVRQIFSTTEYREKELSVFETLINFNNKGKSCRVSFYKEEKLDSFENREYEPQVKHVDILDKAGVFEAFKSDYSIQMNDDERGEYIGTLMISTNEYIDSRIELGYSYRYLSDLQFEIYSGYENTVKFLEGLAF